VPEATLPRRLWRLRPLPFYGFVALMVLLLGYSFWADRRVSAKDAATPRNPETGIMIGAEPRWLGPEVSRRAALLVHGFIGTPQNYGSLPEAIAAQGWRVHAMLLPGHGTTPRDFERTGPDELVGAVRSAVADLRKDHETVVLIGHSMGGAIATLIAAEKAIDGLVLCSPYFRLTHEPRFGPSTRFWARLFAPAVRWLPGNPKGAPVNLEANRDKVLSYRWVPTQAGLTAMEIGQRVNAPDVAPRVVAPTLLVHSLADQVTDARAAEQALGRFASTAKYAMLLEQSDHVLFWDHEAMETETAILDFLRRWDPTPATP
jgi:carboxylesterase